MFDHHSPEAPAYIDHPAHCRIGVHPLPDRLHVITMISNPIRWRSRYENYWRFHEHVKHSGAILWTVEVAFGDRPFEVTTPDDPHHLQLRTRDEIWHKENALNLLIQRLPVEAKYIAWIDADVKFARNDWAQETIQLLQHYDFLQMFSHSTDLTRDYEPGATMTGFMYNWINTPDQFGVVPQGYYYGRGPHWHPGYAWAARRDALDKVGVLIDWAIMGAADWTMACALVGKVEAALGPDYGEMYKKLAREWQNRAERHIRRNVGYMPGLLYHYYHGEKKDRAYGDRHKLLVKTQFDPTVDIKRDWQGLWQLEPEAIELRDGLRAYNRARNED